MKTAFDERKAETRDMIINAARKVFSEKGYHKAQIADIIKEAGISTGSVYAHFHDKKDLFEQITLENLESLRIKLKTLRQTEQPGDAIERMNRWKLTYGAFFDYVDEHPQQILMILRGGFGVDEEHDEMLWRFFNSFAEDIADDFRKWIHLGFHEGLNPTLLGHIIVGMTLHVAHSYLVDRQFSRTEAINSLMALNYAMFSIYLTEKGRAVLGNTSPPTITEDNEVE
ncbi:MAG: TetR/AcrR family transcriptional regulator [Desulfomonilia bacterium]